jgi:hypothetical protein
MKIFFFLIIFLDVRGFWKNNIFLIKMKNDEKLDNN